MLDDDNLYFLIGVCAILIAEYTYVLLIVAIKRCADAIEF